MANNVTPNQANFQTNQNFNININEVYQDFIKEIDENRSIVNVQVNNAQLNQFNINTISSLGRVLKVESVPQESRAHAFYRLIGLPVISQSNAFYNPGLDTIGGPRTIYLSDKITIANNQDNKFKALSLLRENYINKVLNIFNVTPTTITASTLSLTSSITTRSFTIPTAKNTDPFSFSAADQQYVPSFNSIVGANQVSLFQYQDEFGAFPDISNLSFNRYHFIQPFIVDARIDFSVNPSSRKVAVPFTPSKNNLLISENTYVKRPLLEKVIRDRLSANQNVTVSTSQQKIIDYVINVPTVKNDSLIQQFIGNINTYNTSQLSQFEKFLFIIQAMCEQLVKAQLNIQLAQSRYYWIPITSNIGPEGGSDIKGIIISNSLSNTLITVQDRAIINGTLNQFANTFETASSETNGTPDLGNTIFDGGTKFFNLTFNSDTSRSLGDIVSNQLNYLNKKRDHDLGVANSALQTIETIMGEWGGLGLCDIVAIMGALYTMPQASLVGLLDIDAFNRMLVSLNLQQNQPEKNDIVQSLQDFTNTVNDYYNLTNDIYKNLALNNGLNL